MGDDTTAVEEEHVKREEEKMENEKIIKNFYKLSILILSSLSGSYLNNVNHTNQQQFIKELNLKAIPDIKKVNKAQSIARTMSIARMLSNSNTSLAAKGALAHNLQRQGAPKWPSGVGKVSTHRFLGVLSNFCKIIFLIRALLL